jgi:hypothetical protein
MGPRCGGTRTGVYGQSIRRRLSFSLGKYATVFQAEVFAILASAHDIKVHTIPEKHVFALTVYQPRKLLEMPEQRPHWFVNARRH